MWKYTSNSFAASCLPGHAMRMCLLLVSWSPRLPVYCLELPVAVIYVKRGSGCLVGTEQSGDRDHPDYSFYSALTCLEGFPTQEL